jgi:hypothetical protein
MKVCSAANSAYERTERVLTLLLRPTEFRTFVQRAERQLHDLFLSIDKDGNGKLDMKELQAAFRSAGLTVSNQRLTEFFNDMDHNNDGYITFNEWRYVEKVSVFIPASRVHLRRHGWRRIFPAPTSCARLVGDGGKRDEPSHNPNSHRKHAEHAHNTRTITRSHDEN